MAFMDKKFCKGCTIRLPMFPKTPEERPLEFADGWYCQGCAEKKKREKRG